MCKFTYRTRMQQKSYILSFLYRVVVSLLVFAEEVLGLLILTYSYSRLKKSLMTCNNKTNRDSNFKSSNDKSNDNSNDKSNDMNSNDKSNDKNSNEKGNDKNSNDNNDNLMISIIIPIRNNARTIGKSIQKIETHTQNKAIVEIILVDSGGSDNSIDVARASSLSIPLKILKHNINNNNITRGSACNKGATCANGKILIFLKPDTILPYHYDEKVITSFHFSSTILVGFRIGIDRASLQTNIEPPALNLIEKYYDLRFWYCDILPTNAFAIKSSDFSTRNFDDIPLLEDLAFMNKIRLECLREKNCRMVLLDDQCYISPTKYEAIGVLKLQFMDILSSIMFLFDFHPKTIYDICYDLIPNKFRYRI